MYEKKAKYDEAFFVPEHGNPELLKIEELINLKEQDDIAFRKTYTGYLFCPECHKPQLTLAYAIHTNRYFLRGYPLQEHDAECSKEFEYLDKTVFNDIVLEQENYRFILAKLKDVIYRKFIKSASIPAISPFLVKVKNKSLVPQELETHEVRNRRNIYQIPSKSLTAPFDKDDFNTLKLFYGNVDLKMVEYENTNSQEKFYVLRIYKRNINYVLCSITMPSTVAKYLMQSYDIKRNHLYQDILIAFFSIITNVEKNGRKYKNAKLTHSSLCYITSTMK